MIVKVFFNIKGENMAKVEKVAYKRSDNVIPDYDYLFKEDVGREGKKKNGFLRKLFKLNAWSIVMNIVVYVIQSLPTFVTPLLTAEIIDLVTKAVEVGEMTKDNWITFGVYSGVILFSILLNVPFTRLRWSIASRVIRRTGAGIKSSVVRKLQSLSITYHKDLQTGRVSSKFIKDTESVDAFFSMFMHSIFPLVTSTLIYTGISIYKNGIVSLFFLLIIPASVTLSLAFRKKIRSSHHDFRVNTENMSAKLHTMLEMIPVTKSHGLEKTEIEQIQSTIKKVEGAGINVDKMTANFGAWSWVIQAMLAAICLIFCSLLAIEGYISVGEIVLFQSLFSSLSGHITSLVNQFPEIGKGAEALASISEIMNTTDVEINIGKRTPKDIKGEVEFKNVSYVYPHTNQYVVKDFSLNVKAGECIAVVGASGSGKSTLMNMIIGFLPPVEGELLIDGKPITSFDLSEYRSHISVVPQNSILFNGTIKENITYGLDHYSDEDLERVLEMANVNEFIREFPEGINTKVGERGEKLSGGQRQRVCIARALIRDPRIFILDEATSALDNISEYHVQKAIASSIKGRTTFVVAHRLSTIRDADRIIVMEEGKCVESGTFTELMELKGKFYELKKLSELTAKKAENELS